MKPAGGNFPPHSIEFMHAIVLISLLTCILMASAISRLPVLFISHGAAIMTLDTATQGHAAFVQLGRRLRAEVASLASPSGITVVMISAHDVRRVTTVSTAPRIPMIADHPTAAGRTWEASGDASGATAILEALKMAGVPVESGKPSLDHGAWVPLSLLFPDASGISLVTVSLAAHMDPAEHWRVGEALAPLRSAGFLIIGSGGATHSQAAFREGYFGGRPAEGVPQQFSSAFNDWLVAALTSPGVVSIGPGTVGVAASGTVLRDMEVSRQRRVSLLEGAPAHPTYAQCHPTPDHWLPLVVVAGAAGESAASVAVAGYQHSLSVLSLRFDDPVSSSASEFTVPGLGRAT